MTTAENPVRQARRARDARDRQKTMQREADTHRENARRISAQAENAIKEGVKEAKKNDPVLKELTDLEKEKRNSPEYKAADQSMKDVKELLELPKIAALKKERSEQIAAEVKERLESELDPDAAQQEAKAADQAQEAAENAAQEADDAIDGLIANLADSDTPDI